MDDSQSVLRNNSRARALRAGAFLPSAPLSELRYEALGVLLLCPILLSVALWNGFPIIFYDTGAYLLEGLGNVFLDERSAVYSLFLRYASANVSLWLVVVIQALMTGFVMTELARTLVPTISLWRLLAIASVLAIATGLPWYVGQIEPDCMAACAVLSIYLLAFHAKVLGRVRSALLVAVAVFATASHPSHLGLTGGLVLALVLARLAEFTWRKRADLPRPRLGLCILSFVLGLVMVVAANYDLTGKVFISRSGPVFVAARMMQDGIVKRLLDDTCPGSHYKLCAYKERLPARADTWLWVNSSPFSYALGRFRGTERESNRVMWDSLRLYPWRNAGAALIDTALQFVLLQTGDGIVPQEWVLDTEFQKFVPQQLVGYLDARQQRGEIHFMPLNILHVGVGFLALFGMGILLWQGVARRQWRAIELHAFIFLALLGNALICGVLSGPHGRYQSRLIWIPVYVLLLTGPTKVELALRRPVESGT